MEKGYMRLDESDIVELGSEKIAKDDFFKKLELLTWDYNVSVEKKQMYSKADVWYDGVHYEQIIKNSDLQNIESHPSLKHLLMISEAYDCLCKRTTLDSMHDESIEIYLKLFKRENKFSKDIYFKNLKFDTKVVLYRLYGDDRELWFPVSVIILISAVVFSVYHIGTPLFPYAVMPSALASILPTVNIYYQIRERIKRLKMYRANRKEYKEKLKEIKKLLVKSKKPSTIVKDNKLKTMIERMLDDFRHKKNSRLLSKKNSQEKILFRNGGVGFGDISMSQSEFFRNLSENLNFKGYAVGLNTITYENKTYEIDLQDDSELCKNILNKLRSYTLEKAETDRLAKMRFKEILYHFSPKKIFEDLKFNIGLTYETISEEGSICLPIARTLAIVAVVVMESIVITESLGFGLAILALLAGPAFYIGSNILAGTGVFIYNQILHELFDTLPEFKFDIKIYKHTKKKGKEDLATLKQTIGPLIEELHTLNSCPPNWKLVKPIANGKLVKENSFIENYEKTNEEIKKDELDKKIEDSKYASVGGVEPANFDFLSEDLTNDPKKLLHK